MSHENPGPVSRAYDAADYLRATLGLPEPGPALLLAREVLIRLEPSPAEAGQFVGGFVKGFVGP